LVLERDLAWRPRGLDNGLPSNLPKRGRGFSLGVLDLVTGHHVSRVTTYYAHKTSARWPRSIYRDVITLPVVTRLSQ
jgi:hypothetical protein